MLRKLLNQGMNALTSQAPKSGPIDDPREVNSQQGGKVRQLPTQGNMPLV